MKSQRILLVEDDELSVKIYRKLLSNWGYEVHFANDGYLALQMIENHGYDLLITDNQLPFMNGIELTERVVDLYPEIKIIMLTGDEISQKRNAHFSILKKPILPDYLKFEINQAVTLRPYKKTA